MEYKRNPIIKKVFDCYVYRQKGAQGTYEFLILKRASEKIYAGQWRMVGGKVEDGETYWQAALRELNEEIGISNPKPFWAVPQLNSFYEPQTDQILQAPVFAAEIPTDHSIRLDDEHTEYQWITSDQCQDWMAWPQQISLIKLIDQLLQKPLIPEWIITERRAR